MHRLLAKFCILTAMLTGLPLAGVSLQGRDLGPYFQFPPETWTMDHAPFSWTAFILFTLLIGVFTAPFVARLIKSGRTRRPHSGRTGHSFPWWGQLAAALGVAAWILAWTRFPWFQTFQSYTFLPLWLAFIVTVNAFTWRRKGSCLLTEHPLRFLALFPCSAVFWWFFEYLNRFVQNWHYINVQDFSPLEYALHATLAFSTVLPAVLSVREWFLTFPVVETGFKDFIRLRPPRPKLLAASALAASAAGLAGIGVWPDQLFPLLWVSPLLILLSMQALMDEPNVFGETVQGDWRVFVASALAALFCGLFWEMWNIHSHARWIYTIPYVHRFQVFEMPILGYAGYLPFGLQCAAAGNLLWSVLPDYDGHGPRFSSP